MTKTAHTIFISILVAIVFLTFIAIIYKGVSYYQISLEERYYRPDHELLKPSGIIGHGMGILGSFLIIVGVGTYMAEINCRQCHPTLKFAEAKSECNECHKDIHQSTVGLDCSRCHTPASWLVSNISEIHQRSRFRKTVLDKNNITVQENSKVESIVSENGIFRISTLKGDQYTSAAILLAIGRRGSPRKLNIPGEMKEKVAYRLLEPEDIYGKHILVVGGGDSAIESALILAEKNHVTISYRSEVFNRIKPKNSMTLNQFMAKGKLEVRMNSNLISIEDDYILLATGKEDENLRLRNDLVYIFAGGELPTQFLEKAGIRIEKKFGETVLKH